MFLVGLTGGIASGKSSTSNIFKEKQIPVIDADVIARQIVKPGMKAWKEIHKAFGKDVFYEDGELNREALGKIIFGDANKRKLLNNITHPKIQRGIFTAIIRCLFQGHKFIVLDIPLLFETSTLVPFCYKIVTVSCTPEIQAKRLMERDNLSEIDAYQRIKVQMSLAKKCENSHFVVENSASFDESRTQVEKIICALQASNHNVIVKICLSIFFVTLCFVLFGFIYLASRIFPAV